MRLSTWQACRRLRAHPTFALTSVASLTTGLTVLALCLSPVVKSLFPALPYARVSGLVQVTDAAPDLLAAATIERWRESSRLLAQVSAFHEWRVPLSESLGSDFACASVDALFFPLLGVPATQGRWITEVDNARGAPPVVVISERLRKRSPSADLLTVGRGTRIRHTWFEIVGVMPAGFSYPADVDCWTAATTTPTRYPDHARILTALARIADGASPKEASQELQSIGFADDSVAVEARRSPRVDVAPLREVARAGTSHGAVALLCAALGVLGAAVINFFMLLTVARQERARDLALLAALGASRPHLVIAQVMEGWVILLIAAVASALCSTWIGSALELQGSGGLHLAQWALDTRSLLIIPILACALGGVLALAAIAGCTGSGVLLVQSREASAGVRRRNVTKVLVSLEIALAVFLMVCGGLFAKSYVYSQVVDPGYATRSIALVNLEFAGGDSVSTANPRLVKELMEEARRVPYARDVFAWGTLYTQSGRRPGEILTLDRGVPEPGNRGIPITSLDVTPSFFTALEIKLLRGRDFVRDEEGVGRQVILNAQAAEKLWPNEEALGRQLKLGPASSDSPWLTVVGVVENTYPLHPYGRLFAARGRGAPAMPLMFRPLQEGVLQTPTFEPTPGVSLGVVSAEPSITGAALGRYIQQTHRELMVTHAGSLNDYLNAGGKLDEIRSTTTAFLVAAAIGVLTALVGVYGVTATGVRQRTSEIGIRLALGSTPTAVVRLLLRDAAQLLGLGVGVGIVLSAWSVFALRGVLFGITEGNAVGRLYGTTLWEPVVLVGATSVAVFTVLVASYVPARSASRILAVAALTRAR